jgi:hypothetical protein
MNKDEGTEREGQSKHIEREFETGKDEAWFGNVKLMFDMMLKHFENTSTFTSQSMEEYNTHVKNLNTSASMAVNHAVENSNLIAKQYLDNNKLLNAKNGDHHGLMFDRQLNLDEQGYQIIEALKTMGVDTTTLLAVVAKVLADMAKPAENA